jgi:hypothetical protein
MIVVKIVLAHLKKNKVVADYEIHKNTESPIHLINDVVLKGVDYHFVNKLYDNANSVVRININRISQSDLSPDRILATELSEFTFEHDTLYSHMSAIELAGNQRRLCYLLFEKYPIEHRIPESEVSEFLTGDSNDNLLDIKDLVKMVNRKLKEEFGLKESIIFRKEGMVYRIR